MVSLHSKVWCSCNSPAVLWQVVCDCQHDCGIWTRTSSLLLSVVHARCLCRRLSLSGRIWLQSELSGWALASTGAPDTWRIPAWILIPIRYTIFVTKKRNDLQQGWNKQSKHCLQLFRNQQSDSLVGRSKAPVNVNNVLMYFKCIGLTISNCPRTIPFWNSESVNGATAYQITRTTKTGTRIGNIPVKLQVLC